MKLILTILILIPLLLTGCSKKRTTIAIMTKLESGSIVGSSEITAARIFLEKNNIDYITIYPVDDSWQPDMAVKAYEEIRKKGINILITSHVSMCALAIKDRINRDGVFTFVCGATTDELSRMDDYIFRNIQDVEKEQRDIAGYINRVGFDNLLVIRDTDNPAYTEPALKYFVEYSRNKKINIINFSTGNFSPEKIERDIGRFNFDSVYLLVGGYRVSAGSVAQVAWKKRPGIRIMYTPWLKSPGLLENAGPSIDKSVMPSHYPPRNTNRNIDSYVDMYRTRFGYTPTSISLNVYTALQMLDLAIREGNTCPDGIKQFILSHPSIKTDFGPVVFDKYGDVESPLFFITNIKEEF